MSEEQITGSQAPSMNEAEAGNVPTSGGDEEAGAETRTEPPPQPGMKIVISMRGQHATLGIRKPGTDPHLETIQGDLPDILRQIPDIVERVSRRWTISPRHPEYRKPRETSQSGNATPQGPETARLF